MSSSTTSDPVVVSAARWFWWIAGLSLVNVVMLHSGADISFVIGLAMATLASIAFKSQLPLAIALVGIIIGFYFVVGLYAQRHKLWAFWLGLVVYVLDGVLYAFFQDWMSVAFHAFAVFCIFKGITRVRELARVGAEAPAGA